MKIWIFIWRMQPLHLWHEAVILNIFKNNDLNLLILWSSWLIDKDNIFSDKIRKNILKKFLLKNGFGKDKARYKILKLKDYKTDKEWIINLDNKIWKIITKSKSNILDKKECILTFYWWDLWNDYAIWAIKKFRYLFNYKSLDFKEVNRNNIYIESFWKRVKINSTKVRKALKNNDLELVKKLVNKNVFKELMKLNKH